MKKILLIGWKDLTLAFRDRAALVLMLLAPFALTVGLGLVTGRFSSSSSSGVSQIEVLLVNQDGGQLGDALVTLFQSKDLAELVAPTVLSDPAAARRQVDDDNAAAAVIIPAGFTASIIPTAGQSTGPAVSIQVYTNPTSPTSAGVIATIVEGFLSQVEAGRAGGAVAVTQMLKSGRLTPAQAGAAGAQIGAEQAQASEQAIIGVRAVTAGGAPVKTDVLAYIAPGMALMFLMFTVSNGGRSLLAERSQGTLPRLLVSPTGAAQVLAGKVCGIFFTGAAQMLVLIVASTLLFQLRWGDPLAVLALVLAAVAAASGWGLLMTALAKSPGQVNAIGSAIMLTFGILGGSFIDLGNLPAWFQALSKITPNRWGLDGFSALAGGAGLTEIALPLFALLAMGTLLFALAVVIMNRRGLARA